MKQLVLCLLFCGAMAQTNGAGEALGDGIESSSGGWQTYNGRSFIFVESPLTWAQAQQHCLDLGGNLATTDNRNEEDFVKVTVAEGRKAWIGLSDAQTDGFWFWINSKPLSYTNWCPEEPNNYQGPQQCAVINYTANKCWDDDYCSKTFPFVCERK